MNLIKHSANMGMVNFTELLKFDRIIIPEYLEIDNCDIMDYTDIDIIGVVTLVILKYSTCIIFDKADMILSLLFSCQKAGITIPDIEYNNMMNYKNADDLYKYNYKTIVKTTEDKIINTQLICIEVDEKNKVKFFK